MKKIILKNSMLENVRGYLYVFGVVFFAFGFFFTMAKMLWESEIFNSFVLMMMGAMILMTSEILRRKIYGE